MYFCIFCCNRSFFIYNFADLILLSCFLDESEKRFVNFIFSKNQLLVLLIFTIVSFIYSSFISVCIFMIAFLLLILGFVVVLFFSCLRCKVRLSTWLFPCFLRCACIAVNFPLSTAFSVSHRFWVVVFSFSFVSMHILISFLIYSVIFWLFSIMLFNLHMLEFLIVFLL